MCQNAGWQVSRLPCFATQALPRQVCTLPRAYLRERRARGRFTRFGAACWSALRLRPTGRFTEWNRAEALCSTPAHTRNAHTEHA